MYKTIRHGENSLQYTILPQHENGIDGKQLITRRRRKCDLITYIIVFFITLMLGGALTISLRILFQNPKWIENGNRMTMHMKERLYEAFYGKNYAENQQILIQHQHHILNDSKIGNFITQSFTKNWDRNNTLSESETKKSQISTESISPPTTPLVALISPTSIITTTTTTEIPPTLNVGPETRNMTAAWKSVIKTEEYTHDRQNEEKDQEKILTYSSNPMSHEFNDVYSVRRNPAEVGVEVHRDDFNKLQISDLQQLNSPPSLSWSSYFSIATTASTTPPFSLKDVTLSTTEITNVTFDSEAQQKPNAKNGSNNNPWIKSYWPFVDSSTYFQWTVSIAYSNHLSLGISLFNFVFIVRIMNQKIMSCCHLFLEELFWQSLCLLSFALFPRRSVVAVGIVGKMSFR